MIKATNYFCWWNILGISMIILQGTYFQILAKRELEEKLDSRFISGSESNLGTQKWRESSWTNPHSVRCLFDHLVRLCSIFLFQFPKGHVWSPDTNPIPIALNGSAGGAHQAWSSTFTVLTLAGNFGHRHSTRQGLSSWGYRDTPSSLLMVDFHGYFHGKIPQKLDDWG